MRGFTMFLVVMAHCATFCMGISDGNIYLQVFQSFRMPLFFFISGFVFFKHDRYWDAKVSWQFLRKKFSVQILAPFLFFIAYAYIFDLDLLYGILSPFKLGYWFTFTLFEFYFIYILLEILLNNLKAALSLKRNIVHLSIAMAFMILSHTRVLNILPMSEFVGFLGISQWYLYLYFVLGAIVRNNYPRFIKILDSSSFLPICLLVFISLFVFDEYTKVFGVNYITMVAKALTGIVIIWAFFRKNESCLCKDSKLGSLFQYVGRRTLDIYLLHYFLLPRGLSPFLNTIHEFNAPLIELIVAMTLAVVVLLFSLLCSSILRTSPTLSSFLFGSKNK